MLRSKHRPSRHLSRLRSRAKYLFRFVNILKGFKWNSWTTNILNDHILEEIGTATREQDTTENSNRRPSLQTERLTDRGVMQTPKRGAATQYIILISPDLRSRAKRHSWWHNDVSSHVIHVGRAELCDHQAIDFSQLQRDDIVSRTAFITTTQTAANRTTKTYTVQFSRCRRQW